MSAAPDDLHDARRRLDGTQGRRYWRSLEELAETPAFLDFLHREFPQQASEFTDPGGRRDFMRLMGASLALAGLTACTRQPEEKIVPYVRQPEDIVPGRPQFYATAVLDRGHAKGALVESHMGRPTKIEGNPEHPASLGGTDVPMQAEILNLYDPDRSRTLTYLGEIRSWDAFTSAMRSALDAQRGSGGSGLRLLTETVTSPTLAAQIDTLLREFPAARWHQWDATAPHAARAASLQAFGRPMDAIYHFDRAAVVLSLDADFITEGPGNLRYIRELSRQRRLDGGRKDMCRVYAVESTPNLVGSLSDHHLRLKPSEVEAFARALAGTLGATGGASVPAPWSGWIAPLAADLLRHPAATVVVPGEQQSAAVHQLAHAINARLGNVGATVEYRAPVELRPVDHLESLRELVRDMDAGTVALLLVLGGNPVYTAPADFDFAARMDKVPVRVHLGLHHDETGEHCHWHVPQAHLLESWSDARAFDGTHTILQPLIAPLYPGCRSAHEVLAALSGRAGLSAHDLVREYWTTEGGMGATFEQAWRRALHDGLVALAPAAAAAQAAAAPAPGAAPPAPAAAAPAGGTTPPEGGLELIFRLDPWIRDGRFANNPWLQELPRQLTKLTWGNAALVGPGAARRLGLRNEATAGGTRADVVELAYRGRTLRAPAWIVPGHPDDAVTLHLGFGRSRAGKVGTGVGVNAFALRTSDAPWFGAGLQVTKTGQTEMVANTQDHWSMEGRDLVRGATLEEYRAEPGYPARRHPDPPRELSMYPGHAYEGRAWGMAIDLNSCVGCNACVVACQSENNIPVVGKEEVQRNREMQWIRIDRYYEGSESDPDTYHQPVTCMHCENAPCEVVCPVAATVHSDEGLNDMVYNRCVGTRYCANNCPYKVRRFNFFLYSDWDTSSFKLMRNPDVTVRSRGVMEKCTYCVQRINLGKMEALAAGRELKDGDIRTACQQSCPAEAIVFGDINDTESRVARLRAEPRHYGLLTELNTRPRTTYLSAVRNPNPEMPGVRPAAGAATGGSGGGESPAHEDAARIHSAGAATGGSGGAVSPQHEEAARIHSAPPKE